MPSDGPWRLQNGPDGYSITYRGRPWLMEPRASRADARAYLERLRERYPGDSASVLLGPEGDEATQPRTRGGPWRWRLQNGETGVIHTSRKADAKAALRRKLERQRLPNGITWEVDGT